MVLDVNNLIGQNPTCKGCEPAIPRILLAFNLVDNLSRWIPHMAVDLEIINSNQFLMQSFAAFNKILVPLIS